MKKVKLVNAKSYDELESQINESITRYLQNNVNMQVKDVSYSCDYIRTINVGTPNEYVEKNLSALILFETK